MFIETNLALPILCALGLSVFITDLLWRKIFNAQTLPWVLLGPVSAGISLGWMGVGQSLLGVGVALGLFGWFFHKGHMGGGDVKYLMALGALGGWSYAFHCALVGILIGGAVALVMLGLGGRLGALWLRLRVFLLGMFFPVLGRKPMDLDRTHTMPMGPSLALASVWVLVDNPLVRLGVQ